MSQLKRLEYDGTSEWGITVNFLRCHNDVAIYRKMLLFLKKIQTLCNFEIVQRKQIYSHVCISLSVSLCTH